MTATKARLTLDADGAWREDDILAVIAEELGECPAYVEQTGGGCATFMLGTPREVAEELGGWGEGNGESYWLCIGPGWFASRRWLAGEGRFAPGDLYIGPDDCGESDDPILRGGINTEEEFRFALNYWRGRRDWRDGEAR